MAGYSGTPLPRKLGLKAGQRLRFVDPPDNLDALLGALPEGARSSEEPEDFDLGLLFARSEDQLRAGFRPMLERLAQGGILWVAWPKRTSGYPTDLREDVVRNVGLEAGVVDVKVCAIDEIWSGLKFLRRRT
jgi:hypothetical protein